MLTPNASIDVYHYAAGPSLGALIAEGILIRQLRPLVPYNRDQLGDWGNSLLCRWQLDPTLFRPPSKIWTDFPQWIAVMRGHAGVDDILYIPQWVHEVMSDDDVDYSYCLMLMSHPG